MGKDRKWSHSEKGARLQLPEEVGAGVLLGKREHTSASYDRLAAGLQPRAPAGALGVSPSHSRRHTPSCPLPVFTGGVSPSLLAATGQLRPPCDSPPRWLPTSSFPPPPSPFSTWMPRSNAQNTVLIVASPFSGASSSPSPPHPAMWPCCLLLLPHTPKLPAPPLTHAAVSSS